jgi:hypothetical protein
MRWSLLAAVALAGCAAGGPRERERSAPFSANPSLVIATERAFAREARETGTWTAFRKYATKDALTPSPTLISIQAQLKGVADPPKPIVWGPDAAWSSCDGSFAVTTGESVRPNGGTGRFVSVWQRQEDGEYRWVLDLGFQSAGGPTDPDTISARVAECPRPRPRDARVRRGEMWGTGRSNDGTLVWETAIAPDCARSFTVRMMGPAGWEEVFRRTDPAPKPPPGQPAPNCSA